MLIVTALAVAILVAALAIPSAASACPIPEATGQNVVSGQVVSDASSPLAYAKVRVYSGDKLVAEATTNWSGQYRVCVATGTYNIKFSKYGYDPKWAEGVAVSAPTTTVDMTLSKTV